jgi:hypothetical protein
MTDSSNFIQYSQLPTDFRKIIDSNNIMEAQTRPKYNEYLKEWSEKHKITSFFGSDKKEFLQDWNNVKTAGSKKAEPVVIAPVVEEPVEDAKVGDTIFFKGFKRILKITNKTVTLLPLRSIFVSSVKNPKSFGDEQNEFGIETYEAGEPIGEDEQSGRIRSYLKSTIGPLIKKNTYTEKYDNYSSH